MGNEKRREIRKKMEEERLRENGSLKNKKKMQKGQKGKKSACVLDILKKIILE
jgi:hypothetical protein